MSKLEKLVVLIAILASLVAFLDGSIVNVALPAMQKTFGGGLAMQQWVVDAYLLTLGSFILVAGSLSDLFGRKRVLLAGLLGFGLSSIICALAPTAGVLIFSRAAQGLFGALLVPSSLAIIYAFVSEQNFSTGIGQWTSWTSIAFIIGPLLGGFLIDQINWRWIFAINILPIAITIYLTKFLPAEPQPEKRVPIDYWGALLCGLGLLGVVYALTEQSHWWSLIAGLALLLLFLWREYKTAQPMLPLNLFRHRNFSLGNLATLFIYAGLSAVTFLVVIFLQQTAHFSALASGLSLLPVTLILFAFSPFIGKLSQTHGPRWFMAGGPLLGAIGLSLMGKLTSLPVHYWAQLFVGIIIFGIGLALTVAPLTAAVLADVDKTRSGIASAINNAVARIAGLLAIATIGFVAKSFASSLYACALLLAAGGIISALGIKNYKTSK